MTRIGVFLRVGILATVGLLVPGACSADANGQSAPPENNTLEVRSSGVDGGALACMPDEMPPVAAQSNLVADKGGVAAVADANLVNAWGLAFNPSGVAWISANGSGLAIAYDSNGAEKIAVTVPPPTGGTGPAAPTGQLFNGNINAFLGDVFLFVTEDGTISGWQPSDGTTGVLRVDNSATNAVYKGATIANARGKALLIAADFHNAKLDVFDEQYNPVASRPHAFVDPCLPAGYAPFNVMARGIHLYVTYALQDDQKKDDVKGAGNGFVDVYDVGGRFIDRLISRGALNSPWAMAFKKDDKLGTLNLLVGNFGDGRINVYELIASPLDMRARFVGPLVDSTGTAIAIDGLWSIAFGPDAGGFAASDLYFTAGPNDEQNGLFGKLVLK